ncbi:hypothetical protein JCM8547_001152 [Rhodosporidiobolus lusitaniae]
MDRTLCLINPYGLGYDEVTASSLIKVTLHGDIVNPGVVGDIFGINDAGFVIHSAIHDARADDVVAVFHNHEPSGTGIACTENGFISALSQTAETIGPVSYHDFQGIVIDRKEQAGLKKDLGDKNILLFLNHGLLTAGESIGAAWYRMYALIRASKIQVAAQSTAASNGNKLRLPAEEIVKKTFDIASSFTGVGVGRLEFAAELRWLDKHDPSYRT